jgi:predicted DNA-binding protein (UPF0278 family)
VIVTAILQADPAIVNQLERLATTQVVVAVSVALIALSAFGVALGALLAVRKLISTVDRTVEQFTPKVDPLLVSVSRIAHDAEHVASTFKVRVDDMLDTVEDLNGRLKSGARVVEERVKQFGAVVEVVQSEAEELLLDAASTARGVHTAAEVLRSEKRARLQQGVADSDEDLFTD